MIVKMTSFSLILSIEAMIRKKFSTILSQIHLMSV